MDNMEACQGQNFEAWDISSTHQKTNANQHMYNRRAAHELNWKIQECCRKPAKVANKMIIHTYRRVW
jgi:hypothetical protein